MELVEPAEPEVRVVKGPRVAPVEPVNKAGRAESVVRYLIDPGGVAKGRLVAQGFGESRPLVPGANTKTAALAKYLVDLDINAC